MVSDRPNAYSCHFGVFPYISQNAKTEQISTLSSVALANAMGIFSMSAKELFLTTFTRMSVQSTHMHYSIQDMVYSPCYCRLLDDFNERDLNIAKLITSLLV